MQDLIPFHAMQGDIEVMAFATGKANSMEEDEKDLSELIAKYDELSNDYWVWAIEKKERKEFIGTVALIVNDNGQKEIGYRFLKEYWGFGFGTEVCKGLINHISPFLKETLYAYVDIHNTSSIAVLEKSGFIFHEEVENATLNCRERVYILEHLE